MLFSSRLIYHKLLRIRTPRSHKITATTPMFTTSGIFSLLVHALPEDARAVLADEGPHGGVGDVVDGELGAPGRAVVRGRRGPGPAREDAEVVVDAVDDLGFEEAVGVPVDPGVRRALVRGLPV